MPKISDRDLTRLCLRLWASDIEYIDNICQRTGQKRNLVIRECVRAFVTHFRDNERRHLDQVAPITEPFELVLDEDDLLELEET